MSQYILLLVIFPAVAYVASWLYDLTDLNYWFFFVPLMGAALFLYRRYGDRIFKR